MVKGGSRSRRARWIRRLGQIAVAIVVAAGVVALVGYRDARADPVVRRMTVKLPGWPSGARPQRVALLSDIHIGGPATDAGRLSRIVTQVNALEPDLVLIAGDHVFGHDPANGARFAAALTLPLSGLRARLGTVAVLGNHDHWTAPAAVTRALREAGVTVLANGAVARGPLVIVGVDDPFSGHADPSRALAAARGVPGARVAVTHAPGIIGWPAGAPTLVLAGHTHCGQAVLPVIGTVGNPGLFHERYRCGAVRDPGRLTIVTAGLGASVAPLRYGAPPDLWLLTLGP